MILLVWLIWFFFIPKSVAFDNIFANGIDHLCNTSYYSEITRHSASNSSNFCFIPMKNSKYLRFIFGGKSFKMIIANLLDLSRFLLDSLTFAQSKNHWTKGRPQRAKRGWSPKKINY